MCVQDTSIIRENYFCAQENLAIKCACSVFEECLVCDFIGVCSVFGVCEVCLKNGWCVTFLECVCNVFGVCVKCE